METEGCLAVQQETVKIAADIHNALGSQEGQNLTNKTYIVSTDEDHNLKAVVDAIHDATVSVCNAVSDVNVHDTNDAIHNALDNSGDNGGQNITSKAYAGPTDQDNTQTPKDQTFKDFALDVLNKWLEKDNQFEAQGNDGLSNFFSQGNGQENDVGR